MKEIQAHNYPIVYQQLGYNLSELGCLMLDVEPIKTSYYEIMQDGVTACIPEYYSKDKSRFWIKGYVADKNPHMTIMYGFLQKAYNIKSHIDYIIGGDVPEYVEVDSIGYFDSPYEDDPYYCIVAHIKKTEEVVYMNNLMKLLPNIQTFPDYKPHITIAYIHKDEKSRDIFIKHLEKELIGAKIKTKGLNYGNK